MAIMAIYRSSEVDPETFSRYRIEVPLEPVPAGAIFHQVAFDKNGLLVIDIWETEAELRAFDADRVRPALQKMGILPIEPQILEVYAMWAAADARQHNIAAPLPRSVPA